MRGLFAVSVVVPSYEDGLSYFVGVLGFVIVEDTKISDEKRWILLAPQKDSPTKILLAKAATPQQTEAIGNQTGGRVFLFLETDDFWRDYKIYQDKRVNFIEEPRNEPYGTVVVFKDIFGNKWDLVQLSKQALNHRNP